MKKIALFIIILFMVNLSAYAGTGTSGAQFLQIGAGVRAISMGNAYVGLAEGIESIYWNPAGLAKIENMSMNFGHTVYFADMSFENIAFSMPALGGVVGFSGVALLSGDIEITTIEEPDGTGETYNANDYAIGISYSRILTSKFSVGVNLKYVNQNLAELSAGGWAADIGAIYRTGLLNNLRIGFSILNFGPDLSYNGDDLIFRTKVYQDEEQQDADSRAEYITEEYTLPLTMQIGLALDVFSYENSKLVAVLDGINPNDQNETFGFGLEYSIFNSYFIRAGYSDLNDKGVTAGLGLNTGSDADFNAIVDYGFETHEYLGDLHRFAISFEF